MATGTRRKAPIKPGDKPMDDEHRNILRICREKLVKDMVPAKVLRSMVDPLLFTQEDENEIKANDLTRQEQSEKLLDLLQGKGAKAYETFKETIQKVHPHLTSVILEAENEELRSELGIERENSASFRKRLATPRTGRQTCSRCSGSENALIALRREMEEEIKKYKGNIKSLEEANEKEQKDLHKKLKGENRDLEKEKGDLMSSLEKMTREHNQLKEKARHDSIEMERLKKKVDEKQSICESLEEEINNYRSFEGAKHSKLWKTVATLQLLLPLKDDLGNCWVDLGIALNLSTAALQNIKDDYQYNTEKASAVLCMWMEKEGTAATMGRLAVAIGEIGKNNIVHKLIEQLDKTEKRENEAHLARWQENKDELRGESSSSILSEKCTEDCEEKDEEDAITKSSSVCELKDEQDPPKEQEQQAEESTIIEEELKKLQDEVKQKEEVITKLTSDLKNQQELTKELQQRVKELQILEEEGKSLQDKVKQQEEAITKFTSDLKNEKDLAQKLQQQVEESQILEEEGRRFHDQNKQKEETIMKLTSELKNEQTRVQELEQRVAEWELTDDAFKRRKRREKEEEERIKKLTSELKDERKRVQELEQQIHESRIVEEELKRRTPR